VALRVLGLSVLCGTGCALVLCLVKLGIAAIFGYADLLTWSHIPHNVSRSIAMLDTIFLFVCVIAQSYYAIQRSQTASRLRRRLRMELDDTERRRANAELRALKSELNPHFIGNALNAVSVLMQTDAAAASRVIDQLSDLLRTAVDRAATQEVTLREELESLQPFLAVERIRLGRALDVSLNVDERTLDGRVPHMILQPLVENAVKHGFALRAGGHIEVHAHRGVAHLELRICDDGSGLSVPSSLPVRRAGTGLANARARLSKLYGQSASLELSSVPEGGAVARLLIPWHEH
jgi:two-component system, LytTR family, sensor kinase